MNNIYKTKWNRATNSWVACSELVKRTGKAAAAVSLMALSSNAVAAPITCTAGADGSYLVGNVVPSCNTIASETKVMGPGAGFYILTRSRLYETLNIGNIDVTQNGTGGFAGIGNQYASGAAGAAINTGNVKLTVTGNGNINGIGSHSNVNITSKNVELYLTDNYTGGNSSGGVGQYGVLTGSTVDSGEGPAHNGKYTTISTDKLTIVQTATGGIGFFSNPVLNNGIRAIQGANANSGNGSAGQVIVNGDLDMTLTGNRSLGIYVSGNSSNTGLASNAGSNNSLTPEVVLNGNANITINKGTGSSSTTWDSHGIKLGKVRYAGEGAGILKSHGNLTIDTTNALQGGGIKMMRNSILDASDANASTTIKTNGYALEIGGHDDAARNGFSLSYEQAASHGISAAFNNAVFTTTGTSADPLIPATGARKDLIFVDQGQSGVKVSLTGDKTDLTANSDGYIVNVSSNYSAPNYVYYSNTYDAGGTEQGLSEFEASSVTLNASDAGSMTGLVYKGLVKNTQTLDASKTPSLNINLNNGFTWNLNSNASAQNADTTTALFDNLTLSSGAVLNGAFSDAGANNYIAKGNVASDAGIINLDNPSHAKYDDVLTIDGNYTGSNGAQVRMNTLWNAPGDENGADSTSDVLHITGTAGGNTIVSPINTSGTANIIDGNVQQVASVLNTIPVVIVDGDNAAGTFTGTAQTTGAAEVQLTSRGAGAGREYYWTMNAKPIIPVDPVDPPVDPVDPPIPPVIYNPSVPAYVEMPRANMELGYATLATLHERRGENQTLAWDECGTCGTDAKGQTWGRILGKHLEQDGKTRLNMTSNIYGIQIGHDFKIKRTDKGAHQLTGVYLSYGRSNTNFYDNYRAVNGIISDDKYTGKGISDSASLGLTHTRYAPNGSYLDLVAQLSYLHNKYQSRRGVDVGQNGFGAVLSAEVGRPYALNKHASNESGWMIEPQAQLIYQYVDLKGFNDGIRQVDQGSQSGLRGRVGVRVAHNAQSSGDDYQTNTFYGVANIWHDFLNPKAVSIGQDRVGEKYATTWAEIGLGVQRAVGKHSYVYADARYEHDLGKTKRDGYRGTIGIKHTWK
ncbi:MAG: autotransporter outer membrane beta-barrel domain-containing protein [Formosimonas sp.]